jgi:tRNA threonylcarbamoyladenosine biosynthesis protein TsaB
VRVLGLDTATWKASAGLAADGKVVAEWSQVADGSHAVSLLPLIETVLHDASCSVGDLDAIAVSIGPGSFTGLRIGLSVAKGLALATGARVIGVSTLEALARTVAQHHALICALLDARKGELYGARFASTEEGWKRLTPDTLYVPESALELLAMPCAVVGDALTTYGSFLRAHVGAHVTLLPFEKFGPSGGMVAAMGWEGLQAGTADDISSLEPFYIRVSEAELKSS